MYQCIYIYLSWVCEGHDCKSDLELSCLNFRHDSKSSPSWLPGFRSLVSALQGAFQVQKWWTNMFPRWHAAPFWYLCLEEACVTVKISDARQSTRRSEFGGWWAICTSLHFPSVPSRFWYETLWDSSTLTNHLPYNIAIYIAHNIWNIIIVDSCSIHFETTRVTLYVEFPVFLQD